MITPLLDFEQQVDEYMRSNFVPSDEAELHIHIKNLIHESGIVSVDEILKGLARKNVRSSAARVRKALKFMGWQSNTEEATCH